MYKIEVEREVESEVERERVCVCVRAFAQRHTSKHLLRLSLTPDAQTRFLHLINPPQKKKPPWLPKKAVLPEVGSSKNTTLLLPQSAMETDTALRCPPERVSTGSLVFSCLHGKQRQTGSSGKQECVGVCKEKKKKQGTSVCSCMCVCVWQGEHPGIKTTPHSLHHNTHPNPNHTTP